MRERRLSSSQSLQAQEERRQRCSSHLLFFFAGLQMLRSPSRFSKRPRQERKA